MKPFKIQNRTQTPRRIKFVKNGGLIQFTKDSISSFVENSREAGFCLTIINPLPAKDNALNSIDLTAHPMGTDGRVSLYVNGELVVSARYANLHRLADRQAWFNQEFGASVIYKGREVAVFESQVREVTYRLVFEDDDLDYVFGEFKLEDTSTNPTLIVEQYRLAFDLLNNNVEISCDGAFPETPYMSLDGEWQLELNGELYTSEDTSVEEILSLLNENGIVPYTEEVIEDDCTPSERRFPSDLYSLDPNGEEMSLSYRLNGGEKNTIIGYVDASWYTEGILPLDTLYEMTSTDDTISSIIDLAFSIDYQETFDENGEPLEDAVGYVSGLYYDQDNPMLLKQATDLTFYRESLAGTVDVFDLLFPGYQGHSVTLHSCAMWDELKQYDVTGTITPLVDGSILRAVYTTGGNINLQQVITKPDSIAEVIYDSTFDYLKPSSDRVDIIQPSPDGKYLFSAVTPWGEPSTVRVLQRDVNGVYSKPIDFDYSGNWSYLLFSADSSFVIVDEQQNDNQIYRLSENGITYAGSFTYGRSGMTPCLTRDGKSIVSFSVDWTNRTVGVDVMNILDFGQMKEVGSNNPEVHYTDFVPLPPVDGSFLSGRISGQVYIHDTAVIISTQMGAALVNVDRLTNTAYVSKVLTTVEPKTIVVIEETQTHTRILVVDSEGNFEVGHYEKATLTYVAQFINTEPMNRLSLNGYSELYKVEDNVVVGVGWMGDGIRFESNMHYIRILPTGDYVRIPVKEYYGNIVDAT